MTGADACIICGGTLRGDSQYGPGKIGLGDILEIFPFDDAVVCLEVRGFCYARKLLCIRAFS